MSGIMLVDDEVSIRINLEEAIKKARDLKPDLILMDIVLPGELDGIDAADRIRSELNIGVVFITGYDDERYLERAKHVKPFGYIFKPYNIREIRASIEIAFYQDKMEKKLQEAHDKLEHKVKARTAELTKFQNHLEKMVATRTKELKKTNKDLKQEIEDRKRAKTRLRKSEERYRNVVDDMPEMVCRFLPDETLSFVNKAFCNHFETEPKELIGKNFFQFIPSEEREMVKENLNSLYSKTPVARFTHKMALSNGVARHYRWSDRALFGETGFLAEYQALRRDITEEILAKKERSRLEKRLRQTHKMEAIGTLSAGIAHDFNNILAIIIGNVQLAKDDVLEGNRARGNLEEIHGVSLRAVDMVKQILSFCRADEQPLEPFKPTPIIKEAVKFLELSIPATIQIRQNIGEADPIYTDPTQLSQILLNLFTNAAHAMEEKGLLTVGLENIKLGKENKEHFDDLAPGKYVKLTVSDTGVGIAPENIIRIFDPYFTTKKVGEGSGMGLAVVHGIVENHGGAILVDSKPGKGATFSVFFPATEADKTGRIEGNKKSPDGNEQILLVDDEEGIVRVGKEILERHGYKVTARTSPLDALKTFQDQPDRFDLVITDMTMPHMTGVDLSKELMAIRPDVPILLVTGNNDLIDKDKAREIGIRGFETKPGVIKDLANAVRKALEKIGENMEDNIPQEKVLVVDDEKKVCQFLLEMFTRAGFDVRTANDGASALDLAKKDNYAVAMVDLKIPGLTGIETIQGLKEIAPDLEVIIYTGFLSLDTSIDAIHHQVFDYITKPADRDTLVRAVEHAAERRRLIIENRELMRRLEIERDRLRDEVISAKRVIERSLEESNSLTGKSEAIKRIRHLVAQVAPSDLTVLILGESGTGKDVVARLIHESSGRGANVFLKVNCPAIPETLLESELFGHEPGAFTGAETRKPGRFDLAAGGTIFLDEIADLPMKLQSKLLQVIEHKRFTRLGGTETVKADVRIIAATNRPITSLVSEGKFRADLFYRLDEYAINMPSLRHRGEDIPLLANHFCKVYAEKYNNPGIKITPKTMSFLVQHQWPGNVRELKTFVRRFALHGDETSFWKSSDMNSGLGPPFVEVTEAVRNTEVNAILAALTATKWNRRKAAELLKMSYSSLRRRITKYNLQNQ